MDVDYEKYPVGVALSDKIVLSECPKCGKSCYAKVGVRGARYIHRVRIYRKKPGEHAVTRRCRNAVEIISACCDTRAEFLARG